MHVRAYAPQLAPKRPWKNIKIGPTYRRTVCDPTVFAFEAFSPPLPFRLAAPCVRAHRRLVESVPIADTAVADLLAAQLICFRIWTHFANGSVHVSPHTFSRRLHKPKEMA